MSKYEYGQGGPGRPGGPQPPFGGPQGGYGGYGMPGGAGAPPPGNKKHTESEVLSWVLIFICFVIFWPLGLFLLIRKLMDNKKKPAAVPKSQGQAAVPPGWSAPGQQQNTAPQKEKFSQRMVKTPSMKKGTRWALKIVGGILVVGAGISAFGTLTEMLFYPPIYSWDVINLAQALAVLVAGLFMLIKGISMDRALARYSKYLAVIGNAPSMPVSQLAGIVGLKEKKVADDLDDMIEKGYFGPTAFLDLRLGYFFRSRTAAEDAAAKKRAAAATPKEAEQGYAGILRSIRQANDAIADPALSAQIDRLEEVTAQIFRVIEKDEKKERQVRTFLEYYLPTTQKLLDSYVEFEAAGVDGENLRMAKEKIEETMGNIVRGFENQLDALYAAEAMDIQSDIDVMNNMMQRDSAMHTSDFKVSTDDGPELTLGDTAAAVQKKQE